MAKKTATEKFNQSYIEKVEILDKDFSDMRAGQKMLISSPQSIARFINSIPYGQSLTQKDMRLALAQQADADNCCPLTTGIFLRIAIEASLEDYFSAHHDPDARPNLPFWRLITASSPIMKKLELNKDSLNDWRKAEALPT